MLRPADDKGMSGCRQGGHRPDRGVSSVRPTRGMRLSVRRATMPVMYRERPSRLPGAVVWQSDPATGVRVLPDGCMDLLWNGTDLLVAGPDTTAYVAGPTPYTGLRFAPGTLPALLRVPAHELRDRRVPLADLWPTSRVRRMADVVARAAATRGPGQAADLADGDSGSAWPTGTPSALGQAGAALDNLVLWPGRRTRSSHSWSGGCGRGSRWPRSLRTRRSANASFTAAASRCSATARRCWPGSCACSARSPWPAAARRTPPSP